MWSCKKLVNIRLLLPSKQQQQIQVMNIFYDTAALAFILGVLEWLHEFCSHVFM